MKCKIEYIGKSRNGIPQYYCITHKSFASDKKGSKLEACLCNNKELFNNCLNLKSIKVESIKIIYENILENVVPKIIINDKYFEGVLKFNESLLTYKDFGGILLSKLNNISLEKVKCSHCNHEHSDNGKFAYTPHRTHLCLYCGHLFRVKEKNIGNELEMILSIPNIKLNDGIISLKEICNISYDLLNGTLLINNKNSNKILYKEKEISIKEFLNKVLENEF